MNKKVLNSVLIIFMLVIWAIVFNKIFDFFGNNEQEEQAQFAATTIVDPRINFSKDTFNLKEIARDPFLGRYTSSGKRRQKVTAQKTKQTGIGKTNNKTSRNTKNSLVPWPKCSYHGYVRGVKSTSELVLIKINNKFYKVREGDMVDGMLIKKVFRDSIRIKRNKENKIIIKSK